MKYFIKEFQNMLKSLEKVMTMPRKVYDAEGVLVKESKDSKRFDTWLTAACKSGNFYQEVQHKYESYFKGIPKKERMEE